ncbi:hypothetical protein [Methylobacterium oryzisoli]|uniref:hypothetical protein n=1 Tax=Methylobacterium oryzisoli TaxID=3385502 RepID=UPI003891D587
MRITTASAVLAQSGAAPVQAAEEPRALPEGASPTSSATRVDESKGPVEAGPGRRTVDPTGRPEPTEPLVQDRQKPNTAPAVSRSIMWITPALLTLGVVLAVPSGSLAQTPAPAAPPAGTSDIYFAYVPPRPDGSAFVPRKPETTGTVPAPVAPRPPETRSLPNQQLTGIKGLKVVRDICIGC